MANVENNDLEGCAIHKMLLCEYEQVFLRPNEFYIFFVDEDCDRCVELREMSNYDELDNIPVLEDNSDLEHEHKDED